VGKARLAGDRFGDGNTAPHREIDQRLLRQRIAHAAATARTLWGVHPSGRLAGPYGANRSWFINGGAVEPPDAVEKEAFVPSYNPEPPTPPLN
jgi:hypothetical protein